MFKSKTIFIIGAGASCEAGLPSGEALKSNIASLLDFKFGFEGGSRLEKGDVSILHAFNQLEYQANLYSTPERYLIRSQRMASILPTAALSIDNFLEAHQGDRLMEICGKLGIVKSILDAERTSKMKASKDGYDLFDENDLVGSWYFKFFQMLTENVTKKDAASIFDNVSIITFNYDRCIERFLPQALAFYYCIELREAEEIARKLRIWHPYGSVGTLPWQNQANSVPFGYDGDILPLMDQIKTFSEGLADEHVMIEMHKAIARAETVVFLGFAFHPANMRLLRPSRDARAERVFATTFGMSEADEIEISKDIISMLGIGSEIFGQREIIPELASMECNQFFKHYFRSLSAKI